MNVVAGQRLDSAMKVSGKLVIVAILVIALAAAGASWWFRYAVTHQAAKHWGPNTARLIRDAPIVEFHRLNPPPDSTFLSGEFSGTWAIAHPNDIRDITSARGLVHLRHALLDDRSYLWPPTPPTSDMRWGCVLKFRDKARNDGAILLFSSDYKYIAMFDRPDEVISCEPIANGLTEFFAELSTQSAPSSR